MVLLAEIILGNPHYSLLFGEVARHPKLASVPCRRGCFILIIGALSRELACRPKVYRGGKTEGVIAGVSQFPVPPSLREVPRRGGRSRRDVACKLCKSEREAGLRLHAGV